MSNNELPNGWITAKLGDFTEYGKTEKAEPNNIVDDTWVLELEDIEKDTSKLIQRLTYAKRKSKSTKNKFKKGDVLYGKLRPYLNKVLIADDDGVCTTEIVPIQSNEFLHGRFLFYWLKHPVFLDYVTKAGYGLNMPRLGTKDGIAAPIIISSLAEQKEIAARLDDLLAQVDALKTRLDAIPNILKRFRQSVLAAAVSGKLTDRVGSWETVKLQNVATSRLGKMLDKQKNQGIPRPYLRNVNVRWNDFDLSDVLEMKMSDGEAEELTIKKGDILVCEGGEPGRCAIWKENDETFVYQKALHNVRVGERLIPEWLCFVLKDSADSHRLEEYFTGTTIKHFTGKSLKEFTFLLPPLEEQTEIVRRVEELFAFADQVEQQVKAAQQRVNHLTQAILAKAFRGELTAQWREQHPDLISGENSAAALLARIKAEKKK